MVIFMQSRLTNENEMKVFILYLLRSLKQRLTYDELVEMVQECGYIDYFDFAGIFSKLTEAGNISVTQPAGTPFGQAVCAITERGMTAAENLADLIPSKVRSKGLAAAARHLEFRRSGFEHSCLYEKVPNGDGYIFTCKITEGKNEQFSLSVRISELSAVQKMESVFNERPEAVWRGILAMLTGSADFIFK